MDVLVPVGVPTRKTAIVICHNNNHIKLYCRLVAIKIILLPPKDTAYSLYANTVRLSLLTNSTL